jgi:hypothetical protein
MTVAPLPDRIEEGQSAKSGQDKWAKLLAVGLVAVVWIATTVLLFRGYVGSDDIFYSRYAYHFDRPPINHWEFRIPAILAIRACFLAFGPTEIAATLPTLLTSLMILGSVAWFVGWPSKLNWQTQLAMLLTATFPMDLGSRSIPSATYFSNGFLALGTVCLLKGRKWTQLAGSMLLALGFATHEITVFYSGILCLVALVFDWRKFWLPAVVYVLLCLLSVGIECACYSTLLGDPWARFKASAAIATKLPFGYDPDTGIGGIRFFTWPVLENLIFSRMFGLYLVALLFSGLVAWKTLAKEQRILFVAIFATWAWLGYGTTVPWTYKPFYRQFHVYGFAVFGICALLPAAMSYVFATRRKLAWAIVIVAIAMHLSGFVIGGRWGQSSRVSRQLYQYAREHSGQTFVTNVGTMNFMYALGGFQLPQNVVCINGPGVEQHLLVNKQPPDRPRYRFPEKPADGTLVNLDGLDGVEEEFSQYMREHPGKHVRIVPVRYRPIFKLMTTFVAPRDFMISSQGGELVEFGHAQ